MSRQVENERSALWQSLQALSREEGIWRPNLVELLRGDLSELQRVWRLNLENNIDDVRQAIAASLRAIMVQVTPREARQELSIEQRKAQYQHAVLISFNAIAAPLELHTAKLQDRRTWLAQEERGPLKITVTTSQRDLNHAIDQIERILTAGYQPVEVTERVPSVGSTDERSQDVHLAENPRLDQTSVRPAFVDKVASRLFVELRALRRLLGRAGRRIRRNVRRFVIMSICLFAGSVLAAELSNRVQPLWFWFGSLQWFDAVIYSHEFIALLVVGSPVVVACVEIGFATRVRAWMVWLIVIPVIAYTSLLGSIFIAKANETDFHDSLVNEVQHWDQRQYLNFENDRLPEGQLIDDCDDQSLQGAETNKVVKSRLPEALTPGDYSRPSGSELDTNACSHAGGVLTLRTFDGTNALAGDYGRDYDGQIYASVLLKPDGLAAWTDCGIAVVPAADSSVESVPNFGFEFDSATSTYRPIVSLSTLHGEPIVARSATTIPYNDQGSFADSPAGGWLKVDVLRKGNEYTFFVNDRVVLVYEWPNGAPKVHISIQAHLRGNGHEDYSASCDFADFGYWTTPGS